MAIAKAIVALGTTSVALCGTVMSPAAADVSKDYARSHWKPKSCFSATEEALVTGDINGDSRSDAVMLWTCGSGAGGAQPRIVTVWIDGEPIKQKSLKLPLPEASNARVRQGQVVIAGADYSGPGVPRCCPDVSVKLTYLWKGKTLSLADEKRTSVRPRLLSTSFSPIARS